jgi:hypothetical protein
MKQKLLFFPLLLIVLSMMLTGCDVVEGIFKAGMWTAFLIVGLIVAVIIYFAMRFRRK